MHRKIAISVISSVLALWVATPASAGSQCGASANRGNVGGLLGTFAGDLLGNSLRRSGINSGSLNSLRTFLSDAIACSLNAREQKQAADTQTRVLNSGKTGQASTGNWTSADRPGVGGGTRVVSRNKTGGKNCAITSTYVTDVDGKEQSVERELCQQPDGSWA